MNGAPTAATRVLALLGDPVSHSLSPVLHNAALRHLGLDAVYVALACDAAHVAPLARGLARAGGGGNVTVPHKQTVLAALDLSTDAVTRTGACNTFWLERGRVCGDNTDVAAFRATLPVDPAGARVLLLGAGGAARAAAVALVDAGADRVLVHNRTPARARELVDAFGELLEPVDTIDGLEIDLLVNATSLGIRPDDPLPIALDRLHHAGAVFDFVYRRDGTRLVREASLRNLPAVDGLEMLVHQGAAAFRRWWPHDAPVDAMRAALAAPV